MTFGVEKRRFVGWLALLAPLPLPFNEVLEWPLLFLFLGLVGLFLWRAGDPQARWLPSWSMNVLGLLYLPVLFLDVQLIFARGQVVQTMVHLCMFTVLVKLYSLRKDADVWVSLGAVFFLFLAGMGTSVHLTVLLYLLGFMALQLFTLIRLTQFQQLTRYGWKGPAPRVPVRRFVALGLAAAVALSIPLFAIFPRVRNPMIGVRGVGTGTVIHAAGFTDDVTLDSIGAMRQNPEVAIRLRFEPGHGIDGELRLKGASFDTYVERRWLPADERSTMLTAQDGRIRLDGQPPEHWIDLWLQPMSTRALFLPVEAVAVEIATPVLAWDRAGALRLWRRPTGVLPYRVGVARRPVMIAVPPRPAEEPTLDTAEVTPRIAALAAEVTAGAASTGEAAVRLERHLMDSYTYADRFLGLSGDKPLEEFLFERREGHCELFASALVLMLRSEGIPARLVTGFLGGELNPLTGYYVVRQSNAHAWVEAYLPDEGWKILDPTPPAGRPDASSLQGWGLVQQAYDYMKFRWDRYILTYGFQDQVSFFWRLRGLFQAVKAWFKDDEVGAVADLRGSGSASETAPQDAPLLEEEDARGFAFRLSLGLLAVLLLGWMLWQHRRVRTATDAFQRLRHEASSHGVLVTEGTAPLTLVERLRRRYPEAGEPACDVVTLYLRESFGGRELAAEERLRLVTSLKTVRQALRRR